jgi:hypothetical protein
MFVKNIFLSYCVANVTDSYVQIAVWNKYVNMGFLYELCVRLIVDKIRKLL